MSTQPGLALHAGSRAWLGPALLAPLLALGGCGGSTAANHPDASTGVQGSAAAAPTTSPVVVSPAAMSACDLLTQKDAEAATGQPLVPDPSNDRSPSCNYVSTDNLGYGASVTPGSWDSLLAEAGDAPHVSGIGDDALNHDGIFLYVRKGARGFALNMRDHSTSPEERLVKARELALKLLARFR